MNIKYKPPKPKKPTIKDLQERILKLETKVEKLEKETTLAWGWHTYTGRGLYYSEWLRGEQTTNWATQVPLNDLVIKIAKHLGITYTHGKSEPGGIVVPKKEEPKSWWERILCG